MVKEAVSNNEVPCSDSRELKPTRVSAEASKVLEEQSFKHTVGPQYFL